ncbi:olfactory receptor 5V1-like [Bombina bombina]|uniref:olfactory receptor 5V1-like n=1 Tax=Bombina bombina TaxID=8345 RepID=UPI00235A6206|nr:olfactory receptor 5V1-like [Bombina bombina]
MENQTIFYFYLSGFSDLAIFQIHLFVIFLLVYVMTMFGNFLILHLICTDSNLQTPMYFFLGNLAFLDMCCSSVSAPRLLFDLCSKRKVISRASCTVQIYFFIFFTTSEVLLLAVMSCDRYFAICRPLHYFQVMNLRACTELALGSWTFGLVYSLMHTLCTLRLSFCNSNTIHNFICDISHLFQLSCTDTFLNILIIFLFGGLLGITSLIITLVPYIRIFTTVAKLKAKKSKIKAFSTCTSHLTVVFIFYGTLVFNFFRPNTTYRFSEDRVITIIYTLVTPLLNPLIYSLRNQELQAALSKALHKL